MRKEDIDGLFRDWQTVKKELARESNLYNDCQAMFISVNGFTKGAIAAARKYRIELETLDLLRKEMKEFIKTREKLSREFDDLGIMRTGGSFATSLFVSLCVTSWLIF